MWAMRQRDPETVEKFRLYGEHASTASTYLGLHCCIDSVLDDGQSHTHLESLRVQISLEGVGVRAITKHSRW